jgi:hypothetical protein
MGKSVVDLPDPLEQSAPEPLTSAAPAGVDDLLAQMAGDEIDRLLAEADTPREAPVDKPVPIPARTDAVIAAPPPPETKTETDEEGATTAAERSALEMPAEPIASPKPEADLFSEEEVNAAEDADDTLPFYLKPLAWLNAPLEFLPEGVREAVGKIALLTLFNAAAVLIYVVVFRKHH